MLSKIKNNQKKRRKFLSGIIYPLIIGSTLIGILGLGILLFEILDKGLPWLSMDFLNNFPSRHPEQAGIKAALYGTIWITSLTALFSIPLGVGAAIYLEEYAPNNRITQFISLSITNLAGVPSIVYGLLGLGLFVNFLALGRSLLAGSLTLTLLILPIIIIASREAISSVPMNYRLAAFALGATKWQSIRYAILPSALPGFLTGIILALSRAIGESAPVLAITALVYITFTPTGPLDRFTVLPIQIFNWISRPQEDFAGIAAAGIIILLVILLSMNSVAIFVRNKYQKRRVE